MSRRTESENGCTSGPGRQIHERRYRPLATLGLLIGIAGSSLAGQSLAGERHAGERAAADMRVAASMCAGCHSPASPQGAASAIPATAGLSADALAQMLVAFREGERENPVMNLIARAFSPEEITALAAVLAAPRPGVAE